jgi:hypothetical protein
MSEKYLSQRLLGIGDEFVYRKIVNSFATAASILLELSYSA